MDGGGKEEERAHQYLPLGVIFGSRRSAEDSSSAKNCQRLPGISAGPYHCLELQLRSVRIPSGVKILLEVPFAN